MATLDTTAPTGDAKRKANVISVVTAVDPAAAPVAQVSPDAASETPAIDVSGLSPYKAREKTLEHYRATAGEDYIIWHMNDDILECIPGKLESLGVDEVDDIKDKDAAYNSVTQAQVNKYHHVLILPRSVVQLKMDLAQDILYADTRNDPNDSFLMLNTYSSWCMYGVIAKQLTAAVKELNKAIKIVQSAAGTVQPGVAKEALKTTLAAVFACDEVDHWRCDTESPEECEKISKKVSKICKDLLWFEDSELGFVDPYSRAALLHHLEEMNSSGWSQYGKISVKSKKNGQGNGRSHAAPPALKKVKTAPTASLLAAGAAPATASTAADPTALVQYISAGIRDKLNKRVKTSVQLKITSLSTQKYDLVAVSGATCMKKMNQLCAFVSGHNPVFEYHSQRGTSLKNSRFELSLNGAVMWLADKASQKKAAAIGAAHAIDKSIKIVQVFQGLTVDATSGILFDSEVARTMAKTPGSVVWVAPNGERYDVTVQAIIPNKSLPSKSFPMPRIVKHCDEYAPQAKTGIDKKPLHKTNRQMLGDRQAPKLLLLGGTSKSTVQKIHANMASRPLSQEDGSIVSERFHGPSFDQATLETAGVPDGPGYK